MILPKSLDLKNSLPNKNEDEDLTFFRKEFLSIYNNMYCLKPLKEYILKSILERFQIIVTGNCDLREIELSLHILTMTIPIGDYNTYQDIQHIFHLLFNIDFSNFQSKYVLLSYFDITYRFIQFKINDKLVLTKLLKIYFSGIGLMNQDTAYSIQVSIIFNKLLDKLKNSLDEELTEYIIYSLKNYLENLIHLRNFNLICENAVNFNSLSIVSGIRTVGENLKTQIFDFVFQYFNNVIQIHGMDEEKFNEIAKIITNFLKSVGYEVTLGNKKIFENFFNNFIKDCYLNLINYNQNSSRTRYSLITILQRLIIILGKDSINFLAFLFNEQIKSNDNETLEDTIKLLGNSVQILKNDSISLVSEYFSYFFSIIKELNIPSSNISELEKNILSLYYHFVKVIANITTDIPETIFSASIKNFDFNELINLMINICCNIVDSTVKMDKFNLFYF